jgi:serine/threonine-protein kinase RsbW
MMRPRTRRAGDTVAAGTEGIVKSYARPLDIVQQMGWYSVAPMSDASSHVRLEFTSAFDMVDLVQVVADFLARQAGLDDDAVHWVGVAIRESVINAITHGNHNNAAKHVFVEFTTTVDNNIPGLFIRVRDQGEGFDPESVADPLAPENLLKSSGRGIFLIRSFMDDVTLQRAPEGGMEIRMSKRAQPADAAGDTVRA